MRYLIFFTIFFISSLFASPVTYTITVKDNFNFPLRDAVVNLAGVQELTNEDGIVVLSVDPTGVENSNGLPNDFYLNPNNYPNPALDKTSIDFEAAKAEEFSFQIYNILGQRVYTKTYFTNPGFHKLTLDGLDNLAPGIYIGAFESNNFSSSLKFVVNGLGRENRVNIPLTKISAKLSSTNNLKNKTGSLKKASGFNLTIGRDGFSQYMDSFAAPAQDTSFSVQLQPDGTYALVDGNVMGVHPDSSDAYVVKGASVNIKEMNGPKDIGSVVESQQTLQGAFHLWVPKGGLYVIEALDGGHDPKPIEVNEYVDDPTQYNHVIQPLKNITRNVYVLHKDIDEVYMFTVIKGATPDQGIGGPLAKWNTGADGYAHPKVWVMDHPDDPDFRDRVLDYFALEPTVEDAGIKYDIVDDSSQAQSKMHIVEDDDPILEYQPGKFGVGTYRPHIDKETNTIIGVDIYIAKGVKDVMPRIAEQGIILEEWTQGMMDLHDIGKEPYVTDNFYGSAKGLNVTKPTEFDKRNIFIPYRLLPKGW